MTRALLTCLAVAFVTACTIDIDATFPSKGVFGDRDAMTSGDPRTGDTATSAGDTRGGDNKVDVIPAGDDSPGGGDDVIPGGDDMIPNGDDMIPSGDDMIPGGDEMIPGGDENPGGDDAPPGDYAPPMGDATIPGGDAGIGIGDPCSIPAVPCAEGLGQCVDFGGTVVCYEICNTHDDCGSLDYCATEFPGAKICLPQHVRDQVCFAPDGDTRACAEDDTACYSDGLPWDIPPPARRCRLTCASGCNGEQCLPNWAVAQPGATCTSASACTTGTCLPDGNGDHYCMSPGTSGSMALCGTQAQLVQRIDVAEMQYQVGEAGASRSSALCNYGAANLCPAPAASRQATLCQRTGFRTRAPGSPSSCETSADCLPYGATCDAGACMMDVRACVGLAEDPLQSFGFQCSSGLPSGSSLYPVNFRETANTCSEPQVGTQAGCSPGYGCMEIGGPQCARPAQICLEGQQITIEITDLPSAAVGELWGVGLVDPIPFGDEHASFGNASNPVPASRNIQGVINPGAGLGLWEEVAYWVDLDGSSDCDGTETWAILLNERVQANPPSPDYSLSHWAATQADRCGEIGAP